MRGTENLKKSRVNLNCLTMKELNVTELKNVNGGWIRLVEFFFYPLVYEFVTEGFNKCAADFHAGFQSTKK